MAATDTSSYIQKKFDKGTAVSYNQRDLLLYACGIGCHELKYVYEYDDDFAAFPTYPVVLAFKGTDQDVCGFPSETMMAMINTPPLKGVKGVLDGERYIECVAPIDPEGGEFLLQQRLVGIHKRGSGASVETEARLVDKDGKVFYKFLSGTFMLGARNFTDAGTSYSAKIAPPARSPDKVEEFVTSPFQAQLYRLSGDYNPLHVDPMNAKMMGFKVPILHGLCSLGIATRAVIKAFANNDSSRFRALKLRFSKPVLPGQTIVTQMWKDGAHPNRIVFNCIVKETGTIVISNAYIELTPVAKL